MKIRCQRDICVRLRCSAPVCNADGCAEVCHKYLEDTERYESSIASLDKKYSMRKKQLSNHEFAKLSADLQRTAVVQQAAYDSERQTIDREYRARVPFEPCGKKFEIPDDTPVGTIVHCPYCGGENTVSETDLKNVCKSNRSAEEFLL